MLGLSLLFVQRLISDVSRDGKVSIHISHFACCEVDHLLEQKNYSQGLSPQRPFTSIAAGMR